VFACISVLQCRTRVTLFSPYNNNRVRFFFYYYRCPSIFALVRVSHIDDDGDGTTAVVGNTDSGRPWIVSFPHAGHTGTHTSIKWNKTKFLIKVFAKIRFSDRFCVQISTENCIRSSSGRVSTKLDVWSDSREFRVRPLAHRQLSIVERFRTIVDPTADDCPRSPLIHRVPWVLYLHLVLLSKNIFPVPEIVVNPSRLPYRTVANRRRIAQRIQNALRRAVEVYTDGAYRPRTSARITSISDTVSTRLRPRQPTFWPFCWRPCLHRAWKFFPATQLGWRLCHRRRWFSRLFFYVFRRIFTSPDHFLWFSLVFITFFAVSQNQFSTFKSVFLGSGPSKTVPLGVPYRLMLPRLSFDHFTPVLY